MRENFPREEDGRRKDKNDSIIHVTIGWSVVGIYSENRRDHKKRKLPLIEMKIMDQLVNKNVNFVNNGSTDK